MGVPVVSIEQQVVSAMKILGKYESVYWLRKIIDFFYLSFWNAARFNHCLRGLYMDSGLRRNDEKEKRLEIRIALYPISGMTHWPPDGCQRLSHNIFHIRLDNPLSIR